MLGLWWGTGNRRRAVRLTRQSLVRLSQQVDPDRQVEPPCAVTLLARGPEQRAQPRVLRADQGGAGWIDASHAVGEALIILVLHRIEVEHFIHRFQYLDRLESL